MSIDLTLHLVIIAARLVLLPVLRFLLSKHLITAEMCDEIRNQYTHPTPASSNAALVDYVTKSEERVQGFLDALRATEQTELLQELIVANEPADNDADSSKTASCVESAKRSERSDQMRGTQWTCGGLPSAAGKCGQVGSWRAFRWCSHHDCRVYLCTDCIAGVAHEHSEQLWKSVEDLHAAAFERVKKEDDKKKEEFKNVSDEVGKKIAEGLNDYLRTRWDQSSPLHFFNRHLHIDKARARDVKSVTTKEALAAVKAGLAQMGAALPAPLDGVPGGLLEEEPLGLLARLLTAGDVDALKEELKETKSEEDEVEQLRAPIVEYAETEAMVLEEMDDLSRMPFFRPRRDSLSFEDMYGNNANPEFAAPPLLKQLAHLKLYDGGVFAPSVMAGMAIAGKALLSQRDSTGLTLLHIAAGRGATGLIKLLLDRSMVDLEARDQDGTTPLMVAAACHCSARGSALPAALKSPSQCSARLNALQFLVDAGANITATNMDGWNSIHFAACANAPQALRILLGKLSYHDDIDVQDSHGRTALLKAAEVGAVDCARQLLEWGCSPFKVDKNKCMLFHTASHNGHLDILRLLFLENLVSSWSVQHLVDESNRIGQTPLMIACRQGHMDVVAALLDAGARIAVSDERSGRAAIHFAAENGFEGIVKKLIERGSPVNFDHCDKSCLQLACFNGHLEVARHLVHAGADPFHVDASGFSAFGIAAQEGHRELLDLLLSVPHSRCDSARRLCCAGDALLSAAANDHLTIVDILIDSEGISPNYSSLRPKLEIPVIVAAAQRGHTAIVEYLLSKGAEPNAASSEGMTALMFAALDGHLECVEILLEGGATPALFTPMGTALHCAVEGGQVETASRLLRLTSKHLMDVGRNRDARTILHFAAERGNLQVFRLLCFHGANMKTRMASGDSVLHQAAREGHGDIVDFILHDEKGKALLEADGFEGCTPLMLAAQKGNVDVVKALLSAGANPCALNDKGDSALHLTINFSNSHDVLNLLLQFDQVNINEKGNRGRPPICSAAAFGTLRTLKLLIEAGALIDSVSDAGQTALHFAAASNEERLEKVELLIAKGVPVQNVDDNQNTCLHYAANYGKADVIAVILASKQVDVDVLRWGLFSPLHLAVVQGHVEAVKVLLLAFGADGVSAVCGRTPRQWAARRGHADVVAVLDKHLYGAVARSESQLKITKYFRDLEG